MGKVGRKKVEHHAVQWSSRLSHDESEELLYLGNFLHATGKIKENQKYELTKFALRSLLSSLRRLKERVEKQQPTSS